MTTGPWNAIPSRLLQIAEQMYRGVASPSANVPCPRDGARPFPDATAATAHCSLERPVGAL